MAQQIHLPENIQSIAATYQLGAPYRQYSVQVKVKNVIFGVILTIFALLIIFSGIMTLNDGSGATGLWSLLIGLVVLAAGFYFLVWPLFKLGNKVFFLDRGLVSIQGGKVETFIWDQVESYWQHIQRNYYRGIYVGTTYKLRLRRRDGVEVRFDSNYQDPRGLANSIDERVTATLLPLVSQAYQQGQTITFANLTISRNGISNGRDTLPWQEIEHVEINRGFISVKKAGKFFNWSTVSASQVPNLNIFLTLTNQILASYGRAQYI